MIDSIDVEKNTKIKTQIFLINSLFFDETNTFLSHFVDFCNLPLIVVLFVVVRIFVINDRPQ